MSRPLKYGEPTVDIHIRVPKSRKKEIRELVRDRLNGDDGWVKINEHTDTTELYGQYWVITNLGEVRVETIITDLQKTNLLRWCNCYAPLIKPQPPKSK